MSDLRELFEDQIREHSKNPRNFHQLEKANHHAEGYNPLCGDNVTVYLDIEDGRIADVGFTGSGCSICTSSASMMTTMIKGKTEDEARAIFGSFHDFVTGRPDDEADEEALGKLIVFGGVRKFPVRVKCATLPWHTLQAALKQAAAPVSTE